MKALNFFIVAGLTLASLEVSAWDGVQTGLVNNVQVTAGQNYGFRISLKESPAMCGNEHAWAYLNESDSNYNTYVSVLLAAKMAEKSVTVYSNRDTTSGSAFCHIGHIFLN